MNHQHCDSKGIMFGAPHPIEFNHKRSTTQCAHIKTLAVEGVISWDHAVERTEDLLAKEKEKLRIKKRCPECGIGKHGVDSLCDSCYKEYLGTHAGSRSEDQ